MLEVDAIEPERVGFLNAVQNVLQRKSATTEVDLIVAAACQSLKEGPRSLLEIQGEVSRTWPRSHATRDAFVNAMNVARELGLATLDEEKQEWILTAKGLADLQQNDVWVKALRERTTSEMRVRAREGLGIEPDTIEANLWLDALVSALVPAIEDTLQERLGSARSLVEGRISPSANKTELVLRSLEKASNRTEIVQLLQSFAVSALDPLDPFGLDLVKHIATGCVLHSYMAGISGRQLAGILGEAVRQRAILDTPVLIGLLGPARDQSGTEMTIRRAVKDGWSVVVAKHSIDELLELLEREIPNLESLYREAHNRNARMEFYASLVDDQLHGIIISALREGTYKSLTEVTAAANSLVSRLEDMGVQVRTHGNEVSAEHRQKCHEALCEYLEHSHRTRSQKVIERDAETMTMAWRRRRRETSQHWPGAWIITTDQAMSPAYSKVSNDRVSLTLSLAQWTTIIAISARPDELVQLATVAAGQFVDEAIWQLPARYPPEFAIQLAAQLSPEQGGSNLDLHQAQALYPLPEMLDKIASDASPTQLASDVLAERTRRFNALNNIDRRKRDERIARAYVDATEAKDRELEAHRKLNQKVDESQRLEIELAALRAEKDATDLRMRQQRLRHKRTLISIALCAGAASCLTLTLIFGSMATQIIAGLVVIAMVFLCIQWCRNLEKRLHVIGWSAAIEGLGVASAVHSFFPLW
ncbi:hypothetical protein [Arthrobacter sp. IK3]|uniref:hypothetical protein n=1 Tax=Arthrobacter sp. IK3 TaxID=3448169 RepID=UPI003EE40AC7